MPSPPHSTVVAALQPASVQQQRRQLATHRRPPTGKQKAARPPGFKIGPLELRRVWISRLRAAGIAVGIAVVVFALSAMFGGGGRSAIDDPAMSTSFIFPGASATTVSDSNDPTIECEFPVVLVAKLPADVSPESYAQHEGLEYIGPLVALDGHHEFKAGCATDHVDHARVARDVVERRRSVRRLRYTDDGTVAPFAEWEEIQHLHKMESRAVVPTVQQQPQPVAVPNTQWSLMEETHNVPPITTHVQSAWALGYLGNGTLVTIVDDGLAWSHPDLQPGFVLDASADYNSPRRRADPYPTSGDTHGTAAAAVAAARGRGSLDEYPLCVRGVAPAARVAGIRLIAGHASDSMEASALAHVAANVSVYSCSWGPLDDGTRIERPGPLTTTVLEQYARGAGRGGRGCVYVWAAGNGRRRGDTCYADGYASDPHVIAVGAITHENVLAEYSECCGAVLLVAPSSGDGRGIAAADVPNTCRADFGGTSAAAPCVAGVAALVLSANPELTARDVVTILIDTATPVDTAGTGGVPFGWTRNGAGKMYSPCYGYGMVDAAAACKLAARVAPGYANTEVVRTVSASHCTAGSGSSLPCFVSGPTSSTPAGSAVWIDVGAANGIPAGTTVETVVATVTVRHARRGALSFRLTSPAGTHYDVPARPRDTSPDYVSWPFTFVGFRGEGAYGRWTLGVSDVLNHGAVMGEITSVSLTIYGSVRR